MNQQVHQSLRTLHRVTGHSRREGTEGQEGKAVVAMCCVLIVLLALPIMGAVFLSQDRDKLTVCNDDTATKATSLMWGVGVATASMVLWLPFLKVLGAPCTKDDASVNPCTSLAGEILFVLMAICIAQTQPDGGYNVCQEWRDTNTYKWFLANFILNCIGQCVAVLPIILICLLGK